jgi:hypothetical protein
MRKDRKGAETMPNGRERRFKKNIEFTDDGRLVIMDANLALKIAEYFSKRGSLMVEIMSWGELGISYKEKQRGEGVSLAYTFSASQHETGNPDPAHEKNLGCECNVHVDLGCAS